MINKQWCFNKKNLNRENVLTTVYAKMITNHRVHCVLKLINPLLNEQFRGKKPYKTITYCLVFRCIKVWCRGAGISKFH